MKLTTSTATLETPAHSEIGIVGAQYVVAINAAKDLTALFKDITGGRITGYEAAVKEARESCIAEMSISAESQGADAVVGVSFDYCPLDKGGILLVSCCGTAVQF